MEELRYRENDRFFPIPENEKDIPAIRAEHFIDIDEDGNLYVAVMRSRYMSLRIQGMDIGKCILMEAVISSMMLQ